MRNDVTLELLSTPPSSNESRCSLMTNDEDSISRLSDASSASSETTRSSRSSGYSSSDEAETKPTASLTSPDNKSSSTQQQPNTHFASPWQRRLNPQRPILAWPHLQNQEILSRQQCVALCCSLLILASVVMVVGIPLLLPHRDTKPDNTTATRTNLFNEVAENIERGLTEAGNNLPKPLSPKR